LFYVQSFCEKWGQVTVREVRPYHVTRWLDGNNWNDTTRYNAMRSAFRVFNWATDEGLISANPLKGMKRPRPKSRQRFLTEDEYAALKNGAKSVFRTLLFAFRQTGARPSELCDLTWDQVHPECWILDEHKTAHKVEKPRVIYLVPAMVRLMRFLRRWSRSKYVFVNSRGRKWTVNAIHHRLVRLRRKLGLAEDITAYTFRHSFGTHAVLNGVDLATLAELMGHVDTTMVSSVYVHLAGQTDHLKAAAQKAVTKPSPNGRRRGA
jgi:integrase